MEEHELFFFKTGLRDDQGAAVCQRAGWKELGYAAWSVYTYIQNLYQCKMGLRGEKKAGYRLGPRTGEYSSIELQGVLKV